MFRCNGINKSCLKKVAIHTFRAFLLATLTIPTGHLSPNAGKRPLVGFWRVDLQELKEKMILRMSGPLGQRFIKDLPHMLIEIKPGSVHIQRKAMISKYNYNIISADEGLVSLEILSGPEKGQIKKAQIISDNRIDFYVTNILNSVPLERLTPHQARSFRKQLKGKNLLLGKCSVNSSRTRILLKNEEHKEDIEEEIKKIRNTVFYFTEHTVTFYHDKSSTSDDYQFLYNEDGTISYKMLSGRFSGQVLMAKANNRNQLTLFLPFETLSFLALDKKPGTG